MCNDDRAFGQPTVVVQLHQSVHPSGGREGETLTGVPGQHILCHAMQIETTSLLVRGRLSLLDTLFFLVGFFSTRPKSFSSTH